MKCSKDEMTAFVRTNAKDGDLFFMRRKWHPKKSFVDLFIGIKDGVSHVSMVLWKEGDVWLFDASLGGARQFPFRVFVDRYNTFEYACLYRPKWPMNRECLLAKSMKTFKYAAIKSKHTTDHSCTSLARQSIAECLQTPASPPATPTRPFTNTFRDGVFPSSLMRPGERSHGRVLLECGCRECLAKHRSISFLVISSLILVLIA